MGEEERGRVEPIQADLLGLSRAFDRLTDAVIVAHAGAGSIVYWNAAAEAAFGYPTSEAIGAPLEMLMPERMRPLHRHGLARFNRTGQGGYIDSHTPIELPALRKGGEEFVIELTLTSLEDIPTPGRFVMAIIRDITNRVRRDEELRQSHTRLQAEIHERRLRDEIPRVRPQDPS